MKLFWVIWHLIHPGILWLLHKLIVLSMYHQIYLYVIRMVWRKVKHMLTKPCDYCFGFMGYNAYKNATINV